ncbi:MAG: xanthine dehydrogenase YagR molybdenum-binding subunit, partial [Methylobacteriaceae bacterium]|nr:xanthine dehydrogenase YagR molybdenum-binding subunit [Methylobacteriaceae bacterium]
MNAYIGTPTSRIDGRAKVTGTAKYAAEFNGDDLVYGALVTSTIARGRIKRLDTSAAKRVAGVFDVLTHENRPPMAAEDKAWKDDIAPEEGSPYRPLYDGDIKFSHQPVALVLAQEWEIASFAASLVEVDYEVAAHVTDLHAERDNSFVVEKPAKPR